MSRTKDSTRVSPDEVMSAGGNSFGLDILAALAQVKATTDRRLECLEATYHADRAALLADHERQVRAVLDRYPAREERSYPKAVGDAG